MGKASGKLFTDGGSRGNPGPAGIGGILEFTDGNSVSTPRVFKEYIGEATNNQAEYHAVLAGLRLAAEAKLDEIDVYLDSELIVKQLRGEYKVRNEELKPLFAEVLKWTNKFRRIDWHHVPREKNKIADQLVNEALDETSARPKTSR
ncbi:ribonuclease HI family protein [Patescibacteria group bacterium]